MVTVPEVPIIWLARRLEPRRGSRGSPRSARAGVCTRRTIASKLRASGSAGNASDSATTPIGSEAMQRSTRAAGRAAVEPQELGAAAADVDQQHVLGRRIDQRQAAEQREQRLLLVRQDLEGEPGDPLDPGEELDAVARAPAGLGRDAAQPADVVARDDPGADPQRRDRARDRPLVEPAAARDALAEPHDAREAVDDLEAVVVQRPRDQQPAVVGPEVERGHRRPDRGAARARSRCVGGLVMGRSARL